jgi:hypothetical protein
MGGFPYEHGVWLTLKIFPVNTYYEDFGTTNYFRPLAALILLILHDMYFQKTQK